MAVARPDREDVSGQEAALAAARTALAAAAQELAAVTRTEAGGRADDRLSAVAEEADALRRALRSRARRPPPPDTAPLAGAVSAAEREAARSDEWDDAVRAVRGAEADLDVAVVDLAAARGEDV